jgi:hypothetical protein
MRRNTHGAVVVRHAMKMLYINDRLPPGSFDTWIMDADGSHQRDKHPDDFVDILPRHSQSDKDQDHKRQQKSYCECSSVRWRLASVMVTVILHESHAGARQAHACVQAAVSGQACSKTSDAGADADSALAEVQGQRTETEAFAEVEAPGLYSRQKSLPAVARR